LGWGYCIVKTNANSVTKLIASTALAELPPDGLLGPSELPPLTGTHNEGAIVDSNVVSYDQNVPASVRNAVANWLLFAQRAASYKAPNSGQTTEWTDAYLECLLSTGWVQREYAETWHEESAYGFTVHEKILDVIAVALASAPAVLKLVTAAIESLQHMDEASPWITLFDRRGRNANAVGFQVANCSPAQSGGAVLEGIDFRIAAGQTLTQVLFFKFTSREATLFRRRVVIELPKQVVESHAAAISARVQTMTADSIAAYELSDAP
jgi:hypothetical protein